MTVDNKLSEFSDIVKRLEKLKSVKPQKSFTQKMESLWASPSPSFPKRYLSLTPLRFALFVVLMMFLTGGGIVVASQRSNPGDFLYPVKTIVNGIYAKLNTNSSQLPEENQPEITGESKSEKTIPQRKESENIIETPEIILEIETPTVDIPDTAISPTPTSNPVIENIVPTVSVPVPSVTEIPDLLDININGILNIGL